MLIRRLVSLALLAAAVPAFSQEVLRESPRYERYEASLRNRFQALKRGEVSDIQWSPDGETLYFRRDGKSYRYDIGAGQETELDAAQNAGGGQRSERRTRPARGRQFSDAQSPDEKWRARHHNGNVHVARVGGEEKQITGDGGQDRRVKYGIASWVYGEELGVREAMWWSPDSSMLAFYRFDESNVPDYHIAMGQLEQVTKLDAEPYPKPGMQNPEVQLLVHDVKSGRNSVIDTAFDGGAGRGVAEYVYNVQWSPDGKELLYHRTNRKQNVMEFCAADPSTGKSRVILRESWKTYLDPTPGLIWLDEERDGPKRFLWESERNGYKNWYLYDLSGKEHNPVTKGLFDAGRPILVDEEQGIVFYTARSAKNPYLQQLHRVRLDGSEDTRLTDATLSHDVQVSPNGKYFVDVEERLDVPPTTFLRDMQGRALEKLAESDISQFEEQGLRRVERIEFKSADGSYMLYGKLEKPSDFDPNKKYPLIVSAYAGPDSGGSIERFQVPNPLTELGFLVASFDGRGTMGRGKVFRDALYGNLGIVEIDDQAAGVKSLLKRSYVDGDRVGIYGGSYGGYTAVMALLRHPDVFTAAVASSSVTDWRNYDTIYTERYMGLMPENRAAYERGSAMQYAKNLKGKLMLYYGTADNNVHPSNTMQLVQALRKAGKRFTVLPGPDEGHASAAIGETLGFFLEAFGMTEE